MIPLDFTFFFLLFLLLSGTSDSLFSLDVLFSFFSFMFTCL